ncbi:hypothetical protein M408DRAFT_291135 [Serendipita vermifera MAFF 305830]|uniref:Major facilitator superfamily (MFS) profile domain-containing protein n=1 Tax=Serendipita vermifera MAFF 305830 TaxID=933852 RepID=A0A0C3AQJ2_SERVB|nr:hypothetical protein M408DRAFT_291135 [Serendipita vermifera MAFF 305830]
MAIAIANPIGSALGQLIPPFIDAGPRSSVLVLAVVTTVCLFLVFLIQDAPPTPPTFAGSRPSPPFKETLLALIGRPRARPTSTSAAAGTESEELLGVTFTNTERIDFAILTLVFGVLVGAISAFSILINQIFAPVGYSDESSGFIGAALLLTGLLAGLITSPIFDRVLTHHLALTIRCVLPPMALAWIGMIFAVRPNNDAGIYVVACLIGIFGFLLLPVGLELGCEITRNADGSAACLWMAGNLWTLIFVLVAEPLRDPNPPHNMRNELILLAAVVSTASLTIIKFTGHQARRALDVDKNKEANNIIAI